MPLFQEHEIAVQTINNKKASFQPNYIKRKQTISHRNSTQRESFSRVSRAGGSILGGSDFIGREFQRKPTDNYKS